MSGNISEEGKLVQDLKTLLDRWASDIETFEDAGMDRRADRLRQCHAELAHFVNKHQSTDPESDQNE